MGSLSYRNIKIAALHAFGFSFKKKFRLQVCIDSQKQSSVNPYVHVQYNRRRERTWSKPDTKPPCERHYRVMEDVQETDLVILFPQHKEHLVERDMIKPSLKEADVLQQHYATRCVSVEYQCTYCGALTVSSNSINLEK